VLENTVNIFFSLDLTYLAFFRNRDDRHFHWEEGCCLVLWLYPSTDIFSPVISSKRKCGSLKFSWWPWYTLRWFRFFLSADFVMDFAAVCHIVRSCVKTLWYDSDEILITLAKSRIVTLLIPWINSLFLAIFRLFS
jgi:hypothetical protein